MAGPLIGALRVSLSAETASFEAGMKRAQRTTATAATGIGRSLGGIKAGLLGFAGALSIGVVTSAIKSALEYAGSLGELATTLGLTTKDLQTFSFAAGQVGISQEELNVGIQKLTISMGKAQLGAKAQTDAFKAIGISIDDIKGKDTGEVFRLIADKLQNVSDRSKRAAVEVALFGKAGAKLDNLLSGSEAKLSELSDAAEKLGIVLSDEQIQSADKAADKLRAVQTVISANIAGVVADNADSILKLANAFGELISVLAKAVGWIVKAGDRLAELAANTPGWAQTIFDAAVPGAALARAVGTAIAQAKSGNARQISVKLPSPRLAAGAPVNVGHFLADGGKKAKEDHSAEQRLREQYQFDQDLRRANIDILNAKKDLAADYVEQTDIAIQIKDAEKAAYEAELQYNVALNKLTKGKEGLSQAQAGQLMAAFSIKDDLQRQAILADEETKRAQGYQELAQADFDRQRETLEARANLAETAEERRKIELELLQIAYEQKRQALQNILDTSKDFVAIENARRDLANLPKNFELAKQGAIAGTRGPMEDFLASLPTTAAKANEALQRLEVEGFNGLIDSVLALSEGVGSATDSLLATLKSFLLGLARLELQRSLGGLLQSSGGIGGLIGSIFGGGSAGSSVASSQEAASLFGFAGGGSFSVLGRMGIDKNVLALNGLPIAKVSYGERINIGNDNSPSSSWRGTTQVFNFPNSDFDSFKRNQSQAARIARRNLRV